MAIFLKPDPRRSRAPVVFLLVLLALGRARSQEYGPSFPSPSPLGHPVQPAKPEAVPAETFPYLVTTDTTAAWIKEGNLRIVDARTFLDFHAKGHIPGSVRMRWTDFAADPVHGGQPFEDSYHISLVYRKIGIAGPEVRVVVMGDVTSEWNEAAYVVYALRSWGHVRAAMMIGGVDVWASQGRPVSRGFDEPPPLQWKDVQVAPRFFTAGDLQQTLKEPGAVLLDVRTKDEFEGATVYGEPRGGHLPGARPFDLKRLINSDGLVRMDVIAQIMTEGGVFPSVPVVIYDYGGVKAAMAWVILRYAGYDRAEVYSGGFGEWSGTPGLAIETASH